ncbi:hypothetical protein OAS39_04905 [Pirellulales bacterium]|nr:hypothetical protein [Pirellulales bacterium]
MTVKQTYSVIDLAREFHQQVLQNLLELEENAQHPFACDEGRFSDL